MLLVVWLVVGKLWVGGLLVGWLLVVGTLLVQQVVGGLEGDGLLVGCW